MIICALNEQFQYMMKLFSLEFDMSFKHVQYNEYHEINFTTFLQDHEKSI